MTRSDPGRCAGCVGCEVVADARIVPSPALARQLSGLAVLLFACPLAILCLLTTLLESGGLLLTAAGLGSFALIWVLTLRRLRFRIDARLRHFASELPRSLLVREEAGAAATSRIGHNRSQS